MSCLKAFYSTTNFVTVVRLDGRWVTVERPEMDCAIVVTSRNTRAWTVPMHRVSAGDRVVVGIRGVRVERPVMSSSGGEFGFMSSDVSSEKPKGLMVERLAATIRKARQRDGAVLAVCGPAVVHTGAAPAVAAMVKEGWIQVLFAGNGFATHDIESSVLGTSLGIPLSGDAPSEHGHAQPSPGYQQRSTFRFHPGCRGGWLAEERRAFRMCPGRCSVRARRVGTR